MYRNKDYNTQRKHLVLPEYGRLVLTMVEQCKAIEDRELRTIYAHEIVKVMGNMFPQLRDVPDFKHKLWDHLYVMADFNLDIDSPFPKPTPQILNEKPNRIPYPQTDMKLRHYGKIIEKMVQKAVNYEDEDKRHILIEQLANHMKKLYISWNRESIENDVILNDLYFLSDNLLKIPNNIRFMEYKSPEPKPPEPPKKKKKQKNQKASSFGHF